jgi:hypothetical protein
MHDVFHRDMFGVRLPITLPSYLEGFSRILDLGATFDETLSVKDLWLNNRSLSTDVIRDTKCIAQDFSFIHPIPHKGQ